MPSVARKRARAPPVDPPLADPDVDGDACSDVGADAESNVQRVFPVRRLRRIRGKSAPVEQLLFPRGLGQAQVPLVAGAADRIQEVDDETLNAGMEEECFFIYSSDDSKTDPEMKPLCGSSSDEIPVYRPICWSSSSESDGDFFSNCRPQSRAPRVHRPATSPQDVSGSIVISSEDEEEAPPPKRIPKPAAKTLDSKAAVFGIRPHVFKILLVLGAPPLLFNMLWAMHTSDTFTNERNLDFVEVFAGVANVHLAMERAQYASCSYDVIYDSLHQDFMGDVGFITLFQWLRRLRMCGGSHWAPVCSTWIWVSRHNCGRSELCVLGSEPRTPGVHVANTQVSRVAFCFLLLIAMSGTFVLEQPSSSLMCRHPRMLLIKRFLCQYNSWVHIRTWMGAFGAETAKPTRLFSNDGYVRKLNRQLSKAEKKALKDASKSDTATIGHLRKEAGLSHVTGASGLKLTQAYPREYGVQHQKAYASKNANVAQVELPDDFAPAFRDLWLDCELSNVAKMLGVPLDRWVI